MLGADVDAARRIEQQQDAALGEQPFGDGDLLLVAAGECADRASRARAAATSTRSKTPRHGRASRRAPSIRPQRAKRSITGSETLCLPVSLQEQALGLAVLRHQADADIGAHRVARRCQRHRLAVDADARPAQRRSCRSRRGTDPAGPCPAARRRRGSRRRAASKPASRELAVGREPVARASTVAADRRGPRRRPRREGRAPSERPMIIRITSSSPSSSTAAVRCRWPLRSTVSRSQKRAHLGQAVRDEDDGHARRRRSRSISSPSQSMSRPDEGRGRLVEQQDARLAEDGAAISIFCRTARSSVARSRRRGSISSSPRLAKCARDHALGLRAAAAWPDGTDRRVGQQHVVERRSGR